MKKKLYLMPEIQVVAIQGNCVMQALSGNGETPGQANPGDKPGDDWDPEDGGDSRRGNGWFDED